MRPSQPQASDAAFDQVIDLAREQLSSRTAQVEVGAGSRAGDALEVPVTVRNLAGHKLPTGHPTRRAWLRLRVWGGAGRLVFVSGEHDGAGRLVDRTGAPLPAEQAGGPTYPHRQRIAAEDEVQVWESVMHDEAGQPTYLLLRGEGYLKDDRLLPRGWSASHPAAAERRRRAWPATPTSWAGPTRFTSPSRRPPPRAPTGSRRRCCSSPWAPASRPSC